MDKIYNNHEVYYPPHTQQNENQHILEVHNRTLYIIKKQIKLIIFVGA